MSRPENANMFEEPVVVESSVQMTGDVTLYDTRFDIGEFRIRDGLEFRIRGRGGRGYMVEEEVVVVVHCELY